MTVRTIKQRKKAVLWEGKEGSSSIACWPTQLHVRGKQSFEKKETDAGPGRLGIMPTLGTRDYNDTSSAQSGSLG